MKKILALLFAIEMVLSLFACTAKGAAEATEPPPEATEAPAEATEAPAEAAEAPAEATEAPAAAGVQRIIVWNNAIEGLTASDQPRSEGDLRSAYSIKDSATSAASRSAKKPPSSVPMAMSAKKSAANCSRST